MDVTRYAQMVNDGQNIETVAEIAWNENGRIAGQYQAIWKAIADKVSATTKYTKYNGSRGTIKHMIRTSK